jgi:Effector-associated domain 4/NB-ARC domain
MPRYSYGEQVKERVKQLLKALLDYASNEFDDYDIDITFVWHTETELVVRTTLSALEALTARQLTKVKVREALSLLRDFLHILEDLRVSARGSQDWHFKLKLWSRDKEQNLRQFDREWEKFRLAKSGVQQENTSELAETVHTASLQKLPYNNIPQTGVREFVGRKHELEKLHQLLQEDDQIAITAIAGMGGVGKTELAIQYAIQYMNDYPGGVCWLQASHHNEGEYIGQQIVEFARPQIVNFTLPDDFTLREKVTFCWQHWPQGDVLIVLDDVTDYTKVKPYLPPVSSRFKVLLTTRLQLGTSVRQLSLDVLTSDSALALLKVLIGSARVEREQKVAENICKWLGYLPLGVELVGRYLNRKPDLSITEMFFRLQNKRLEQYSLKHPSTEADMTAKQGIKDAFNVSWDELNEEAKLLGCLLGLFAKAPIPWQFVEQCLAHNFDPEFLEEIRDYYLKALHFIHSQGHQIYQLHPLIREFFRSKLVEIGEDNHLS